MNTQYLKKFKGNLISTFVDNFPDLYNDMKNSEHGLDPFNLSKFHLEGDVWTHTMMVLSHAETELGSICALLHDIGKPKSRIVKKDLQRTVFANHEGLGFFMLNDILHIFDLDKESEKIVKMVVALHGSFRCGTMEEFIELTAGLDEKTLRVLVELLYCDSNGRINFDSGIWKWNIEDILYSGYREYYLDELQEENLRKHKTVTFLIGLPCSGKTTFLENNNLGEVFSRVALIEKHGKGHNYDDKFAYFQKPRHTQELNVLFDKHLESLYRGDNDVVIDMTNLRESKRNKMLKKFTSRGFKANAMVFSSTVNECVENNKLFEGENVSWDEVFKMAKLFTFPLFGKNKFNNIEII